jgi:hypothetical protein
MGGVSGTSAVLAAEDQFFQALLRGDRASLERVLAPDFLLIDVMTGSEIPRPVLLELVGSRQLVFASVERTTPGSASTGRPRSSRGRRGCRATMGSNGSRRTAATPMCSCRRVARGAWPRRKAHRSRRPQSNPR